MVHGSRRRVSGVTTGASTPDPRGVPARLTTAVVAVFGARDPSPVPVSFRDPNDSAARISAVRSPFPTQVADNLAGESSLALNQRLAPTLPRTADASAIPAREAAVRVRRLVTYLVSHRPVLKSETIDVLTEGANDASRLRAR